MTKNNKKTRTEWNAEGELDNLLPSESGEEIKEKNRWKVLTSKKLLIWLPVCIAQIKARNNSSKLKNEIRRILYLLYQLNKINKTACNNSINSL